MQEEELRRKYAHLLRDSDQPQPAAAFMAHKSAADARGPPLSLRHSLVLRQGMRLERARVETDPSDDAQSDADTAGSGNDTHSAADSEGSSEDSGSETRASVEASLTRKLRSSVAAEHRTERLQPEAQGRTHWVSERMVRHAEEMRRRYHRCAVRTTPRARCVI
jgi:hypothetical protein